ncbi:tyrosine-type recombinase/integrase [Methanoplanus endosymbiosus]|uniref:Site-specific integrase n=1 Tax=Methanoplanus endosymbiosus TaxID=33865 RepID=A0A9E7PPV1_9EURY|nr:site-specific integrase [Methanoplanus endosymbiosus]UUX93257.1 site-specific integrase [Methanoplanus endosymbiosus]
MANQTFHHQEKPNYHEELLNKALESGKLLQEDYIIIKKFINSKSVSRLRRVKLVQTLISWRKFFQVSFLDADIDDLHIAKNNMESYTKEDGNPFSKNTKNDYIKILKTFYRWLIGRNLTEITLQNMQEIKAPGMDYNTTQPEELLTFDEISKIVSVCKSHRDKAIIFILYETGARIKELCFLKWKDVHFEENGTISLKILNSKNEKEAYRHGRVIMGTEYLAAWRNNYFGFDATGENYVFITSGGKPLEYRAASQIITRAGKRAGIRKRVHPHLFRKSRITQLVRENYQESVIKQMMWGNLNTDMFQVYVKLSSDDIDKEIYRKSGMELPEEDEKKSHLPKQCKFCFAMNSPASKFCHMCAKPLTQEAAQQQAKITDELHRMQKEDPAKLQELMIQMISRVGMS